MIKLFDLPLNKAWKNHLTVSEQLAIEYSKKVDEIIKFKIDSLSHKVLKQGEYRLYEILKSVDKRYIEHSKDILEKNGYLLNIDFPKTNLSIEKSEDNVFRATLNPHDIKVHVYKKISSV